MESMQTSINRVISNYDGSNKKRKSNIVDREISMYVSEVIKKARKAYARNNNGMS